MAYDGVDNVMDEDMDEDINNDDKFHLLHIINDTQAIFKYCRILRKENIKDKLRFELGSTQAEAVRLRFYKKFKFS